MYSNYLLKQAIFIKACRVSKLQGCCTLQGCFQGRGSGILLHRPKKHRCFVPPFWVPEHVGDIWGALFSICFNHGSYGMKGVGPGNPH